MPLQRLAISRRARPWRPLTHSMSCRRLQTRASASAPRLLSVLIHWARRPGASERSPRAPQTTPNPAQHWSRAADTGETVLEYYEYLSLELAASARVHAAALPACYAADFSCGSACLRRHSTRRHRGRNSSRATTPAAGGAARDLGEGAVGRGASAASSGILRPWHSTVTLAELPLPPPRQRALTPPCPAATGCRHREPATPDSRAPSTSPQVRLLRRPGAGFGRVGSARRRYVLGPAGGRSVDLVSLSASGPALLLFGDPPSPGRPPSRPTALAWVRSAPTRSLRPGARSPSPRATRARRRHDRCGQDHARPHLSSYLLHAWPTATSGPSGSAPRPATMTFRTPGQHLGGCTEKQGRGFSAHRGAAVAEHRRPKRLFLLDIVRGEAGNSRSAGPPACAAFRPPTCAAGGASFSRPTPPRPLRPSPQCYGDDGVMRLDSPKSRPVFTRSARTKIAQPERAPPPPLRKLSR